MATDYRSRLMISVDEGDHSTKFTDKDDRSELIAVGYTRIVIGGRGPYIEFDRANMVIDSMFSVPDEHYYFDELRTIKSNLMVYLQRRPVDYADYRVGMYYISPFDLLANGLVIIEKLRKT